MSQEMAEPATVNWAVNSRPHTVAADQVALAARGRKPFTILRPSEVAFEV